MNPRGLWLLLLPALYLPNLGVSGATAFGRLELSDFLIIPYVVLASLAIYDDTTPRNWSRLRPWLIAFVAVAALSTLTISVRYPFASDYPTVFGLLKLAKLSLYGVAGLLTARALANWTQRAGYDWALLAAAWVIAVALFINDTSQGTQTARYSSDNAISVAFGVMLTFLIGRVTVDNTPRAWRTAVIVSLPVLVIGFGLSNGRGGWLAAIVGIGFLYLRSRLSWRSVGLVIAGVCTVAVAYTQYPTFREDVDRTLWPDQVHLDRYGAGVAGIDDGARLTTWKNEFRKLPQAALIGTGFFHRGGESPLWISGSHNFWLQMLLETGLIGFLVLGRIAWVAVGHTRGRSKAKLGIPTQAALMAAFVGGLGGEYLYGGMVLFTVFAIYAPVGSFPARREEAAPSAAALSSRGPAALHMRPA